MAGPRSRGPPPTPASIRSRVAAETDRDDAMEGLYLKVEDGDTVTGRLKWVRPTFLTAVLDSGSHWLDRPIVANGLRRPGGALCRTFDAHV